MALPLAARTRVANSISCMRLTLLQVRIIRRRLWRRHSRIRSDPVAAVRIHIAFNVCHVEARLLKQHINQIWQREGLPIVICHGQAHDLHHVVDCWRQGHVGRHVQCDLEGLDRREEQRHFYVRVSRAEIFGGAQVLKSGRKGGRYYM